MKKVLKLWLRITNLYSRVIPLMVFLVTFVVVELYIKSTYVNFVEELPIHDKRILYIVVGILAFTGVIISLKTIWEEAISDEFQFQYWLRLNEKDFYILLFLEKIGWYYFYLIIMSIVTVYTWYTLVFWWVFYSVLYICITYWIHKKTCFNLHHGKKQQRKVLKKDRKTIVKCHFIESNPNSELIILGIIHRYRSVEAMVCKVIVVGLAMMLPARSIDGTFWLVVYLILSTILVLSNEGYWRYELENTCMIRMSGVSFIKYFSINYVSDILFNTLPLSVIFIIVSNSEKLGLLFCLGSCIIVFYCNLLHTFTGIVIGKEKEWMKTLAFLMGIVLGFFPIANLVFGVYLYKRVLRKWEGSIC